MEKRRSREHFWNLHGLILSDKQKKLDSFKTEPRIPMAHMVLGNAGNEHVPQETAKRLEKAVNFTESRRIAKQCWIAHVLYELFWKINWTEASVVWVTSHEWHGEEKHPQNKQAHSKKRDQCTGMALHVEAICNLTYLTSQHKNCSLYESLQYIHRTARFSF